jgi:hypothetical protein
LDVRPEFLDAAMQSLDVGYGGVDGYLQTVGKLSASARDQLRRNLLQ